MATHNERTQHKFWVGWVIFNVLWGSLFTLSKELSAEERQRNRYEFLQIRMGIPVNITVYAGEERTANEGVKAAYTRFRELDRIMSDYDPDSELMQLCSNAKVGVPYQVSEDLYKVLKTAVKLSEETNGAFDITVAPVIKLWRIARRRKTLPDTQKLDAARQRVGYQNLKLCRDENHNGTVTFLRDGVRIDLGAIAKGYAADEALKVLKQQGLNIALIDAGGDIVAGDPPPDADAWRIEIESLSQANSSEKKSVPFILELSHCAIATSGDAYQYIEINGTRYSHIVNPKTGLGLMTPSSVTIIAPTCMEADSLASAVSVLGPQAGLKLINTRKDCEAYVMQLVHKKEGDQETVEILQTANFQSYRTDD